MNELERQLNPLLVGDDLRKEMAVLPRFREEAETPAERMAAVADVYRVYVPTEESMEAYARMHMAVVGSLQRKGTAAEARLMSDNFRASRGLRRYGVIGGFEAFRITGEAGLGKTSCVERCAELISGGRTLKSNDPYREVVPVLIVECVADGSFKSLLYSILQGVDNAVGTDYLAANRKATATVDSLLSAASNVLMNHVGLLVIDEMERVANDSRRGETLVNYLTQLVNQAGVPVCFVGSESANRYFSSREYLSRRTVGISLRRMEYGKEFCEFAGTLLKYQYVARRAVLDGELARCLYSLSGGMPSMVVGLVAEAQRGAIMSGRETLDCKAFKDAFNRYFSNMAGYVGASERKPEPKGKSEPERKEAAGTPDPHLFADVARSCKKDLETAVSILKGKVAVEFA